MAVRTATRRWPNLGTFLREYPSTLQVGALVLPAGTLDGEPAPELKVDLVLPLGGRVGPLAGQVVARMQDGSVALRIPEVPPRVAEAIAGVFATVDEVRAFLLASRQLVAPEEVEALRVRVAELEARPVAFPATATTVATAPGAGASAVGAPPASTRGYAVPDVSGLEPVLAGSLADRSLRDAFMALAVEKMTGLLTIRYRDHTRCGFWSKGGPVGWRTEPLDEQEVLGVLLWRAGTITKEQLAESLRIMEARGCRQGEALIEMGVLSFPQLVLVLQKQAEFILQRVMRDREGTWEFHVLEDLPERFVTPPLRVASLLYRALVTHVKEMPAEELATVLRPWLDQYIWVTPGVERTFEEMKLNVDEQAFVKIIQKTVWRLREVFSVSSLSRSQTAAFVWCLHELNLVEFRQEGSAERVHEKVSKDLKKRRNQVFAGTMFDRLDLHWICTTPEVEASWKKLSVEFGPEAATRHDEEYRPTLLEIHKLMSEAYDLLKNDAKRREYRASIMEKMKIEQSAEMLARQGEMAIMKAAARDAMNCWSKAVELVPNKPEYKEGLNRAKKIPSV